MHCKFCSKEIQDISIYCPYCGSKVRDKKPGDYSIKKISCPKCGNDIEIALEERPLTIECKKCGHKGTIKKCDSGIGNLSNVELGTGFGKNEKIFRSFYNGISSNYMDTINIVTKLHKYLIFTKNGIIFSDKPKFDINEVTYIKWLTIVKAKIEQREFGNSLIIYTKKTKKQNASEFAFSFFKEKGIFKKEYVFDDSKIHVLEGITDYISQKLEEENFLNSLPPRELPVTDRKKLGLESGQTKFVKQEGCEKRNINALKD